MGVAETILEGNRRKLTATFRVPDEVGQLTDPDTVTFYIRHIKTGTLVTIAGVDVTHDGLGVYSVNHLFDVDGQYVIGAEGTGACAAYSEIVIVVENARAKG